MTSSPFTDSDLAIVRRAYARQMLAIAGASGNAALERAFAAVRRERFLGPPPWLLSHGFGHIELPSDDPVPLYQDRLIALSAKRGVNNGSPSLHAAWLHAVALREGERVAHLGAGAGYYTAIIAELVGPEGSVLAVEVDPQLAGMAAGNLADRANVRVATQDAARILDGAFDCIYVNFAVEQPIRLWTDRLAMGGRLIFPLGVAEPTPGKKGVWHSSHGAGLLVERKRRGLAVKWLGRAFFVCAEGEQALSAAERDALRRSFEKGGVEFVQSLHWDNAGPPERNWHMGKGWRLGFDEVGE
jgi:protein-L-isoaspartate(D-aspartate) O-methyltransferase